MGDRGDDKKASLPKAYDVEAREREERKRKAREGEEGSELDRFPVMMSFKAFLETQDDSITDEEALIKYGEYKLEFRRQKINEFFVLHKNQEWFRLKYHPNDYTERNNSMEAAVKKRCDIFLELEQKGLMEGISCSQEQETEVVKLLDSLVILLENGTYEDIKNLDAEMNNNDSVKHKSSSLFIKNLHQNITHNDLETLVKKFPGYQRLAVSAEADPHNQFVRKAWISFKRNAKIREICYAINNTQINGQDLQAVVNKDLSSRIRVCDEPILNKAPALHKDISIALNLIKYKDVRSNVWKNKNGQDDKDKASDENKDTDKSDKDNDNTETKNEADADHKQKNAPEQLNIIISETEKALTESDISIEDLKMLLDRLVLYLRMVHSIDFYGQKEYKGEDRMPNRCGLLHIRTDAVSDFPDDDPEVDKFLNSRDQKFSCLLQDKKNIEETEAKKLGLKDENFEIDKFISANSQELSKDKWLCTLSGKKFKALEFIKKHIFNKFAEKVTEVKTEVKFFNNYILDPTRPQIPEQKIAPPLKKARISGPTASQIVEQTIHPVKPKTGVHARLGTRPEVGSRTPPGTVKVTYATTDPRDLVDYSDVDLSMFDTFG